MHFGLIYKKKRIDPVDHRSLSDLALACRAYGESTPFITVVFCQTGPLFSLNHRENGLDFPQCSLRRSLPDRLLAIKPDYQD